MGKLETTLPSYERTAAAFAKLARDNLVGEIQAEEKQREAVEKERDLEAQRASVESLRASVEQHEQRVAQLTSAYVSDLNQQRLHDEPLLAEVSIENKDVGFVAVDQPVRIKLVPYQFQKYGMLEGTVRTIGADSSAPAANAGQRVAPLTFKALIELKEQRLQELPLAAGMEVSAEIVEGKRTVLQYLLSRPENGEVDLTCELSGRRSDEENRMRSKVVEYLRSSSRAAMLLASLTTLLLAPAAYSASRLPQPELDALRAPPKATSPAKRAPQRSADERGTAGNDGLDGSDENDPLAGGAGDGTLNGAGGNDELLGETGNDYLDGAGGNDSLRGGPGDDRYRFFGRDGGHDTIIDTDGRNVLLFMDVLNPMGVQQSGDGYVISYGGNSSIRMSSSTFDTFKFLSLNTLLDKEEFLQMYGRGEIGYPRKGKTAQGKVTLTAGPMGQQVDGSPADEVLVGGGGTDLLIGGGGNDEFRPGGPAGATAIGGTGNDVYIFGRNDGRLLIRDEGGVDEIRMDVGIKTSDVTVRVGPGALIILVAGTAQAAGDVMGENRWSIQIVRLGNAQAGSIERIVFADGTIWNELDKRAR